MASGRRIDLPRCEDLAARGAAGEAAACKALVEELWPAWIDLVGASRSMGPLRQSEDHVHNVVAKLVEKIGEPRGRGLRLYPLWRDRHPGKTFEDWIRIVTANAVRDYARAQLGEAPVQPSGDPSAKRLLNEFATSGVIERLGFRPPVTAAQTARQLLEYAQTELPEAQYRALTLWIEGTDFEEIAADLELEGGEAARRLVRASVAVLRRKFAG